MRFFGIDLAFREKNDTGLSVLDEKGSLIDSKCVKNDEEIFNFLKKNSTGIAVVAVDAPLVVPNESRQRPCERLVGQLYGKFDAACNSSNKKNLAGKRGPTLISYLKKSEFPVCVSHDASKATSDNWPVVEVYPHTGHIELFKLNKTLKYKSRNKDMGLRKCEFRRYICHINHLSYSEPSLRVETVEFLKAGDLETLNRKDLKIREDLLDSLFCAYTALYLWHHRGDANRWTVVKGERTEDFITIPRHLDSHTDVGSGVVSTRIRKRNS